jgi:hypothetical protein
VALTIHPHLQVKLRKAWNYTSAYPLGLHCLLYGKICLLLLLLYLLALLSSIFTITRVKQIF